MSEHSRVMADIRERLVLAALHHVPFDGWSPRALREAAKEIGYDETMGERAFPGGPVEAVEQFAALADRRLEAEAATAGLDSMKTSRRIAWLIRRRLEAWAEHREAIRRAVSLLTLPIHGAAALRATWRTVDTLWYAAGDNSTDFSFYTRRATLAAIYTSTLLYWLEDNSDGFVETWNFLDRRLADAMVLPKLRKQAYRRLHRLPNPLNLLTSRGLRRHRAGARA
jgi:ubiquinone biosynthesis protein COQ9